MNKLIIIDQIDVLVKSRYSRWHIGITSDPDKSRIEQGEPKPWRYWSATYLGEAIAVRDYFVEKGVQFAEDKYGSGNYIYVF